MEIFKGIQELIGKRIRIISQDPGRGQTGHSDKRGILKATDDNFMWIETNNGLEGIPLSKLIRIEVLENGS